MAAYVMKQLKHGWQSAYRLTLGRLGLRQRLLVMLLLLVTIAIGISFYSEYTIHSDMLETEIAADVDTVATLLLSSLQFRDGQPSLPYDPRRSPLNERLFGEARVRFRIVQVSLTETTQGCWCKVAALSRQRQRRRCGYGLEQIPSGM